MSKPPQKRSLETRRKLKTAAEAIVSTSGFAALRVEDVVARAGVAKGTFFSHFSDKDRLMAELIGERMSQIWRDARESPPPGNVSDICHLLDPLLKLMSSERDVFDLIIRYSGAASIEEETLISQNFMDQIFDMAAWIAPLQGKTLRADVEPEFLADGVQAFLIQAIALDFCRMHTDQSSKDRLQDYLEAWLAPKAA